MPVRRSRAKEVSGSPSLTMLQRVAILIIRFPCRLDKPVMEERTKSYVGTPADGYGCTSVYLRDGGGAWDRGQDEA